MPSGIIVFFVVPGEPHVKHGPIGSETVCPRSQLLFHLYFASQKDCFAL